MFAHQEQISKWCWGVAESLEERIKNESNIVCLILIDWSIGLLTVAAIISYTERALIGNFVGI